MSASKKDNTLVPAAMESESEMKEEKIYTVKDSEEDESSEEGSLPSATRSNSTKVRKRKRTKGTSSELKDGKAPLDGSVAFDREANVYMLSYVKSSVLSQVKALPAPAHVKEKINDMNTNFRENLTKYKCKEKALYEQVLY